MNAVLSPQSLAPPASLAVAALRADGLGKAYGSITVLSDVTLDIRAGEVHAIIGENGAGKSTLMKLLSGHVAPTTGHLLIEGEPVEFRNAVEAEAAGIVLVHQEILLAADLTVAENLFLGRELGRGLLVDDRADEPAHERASGSRRLDGAAARPGGRPASRPAAAGTARACSPGPLAQRQLVQIARALLDERKVVILDEPTAMLANDEVAALLAIVRSLRDRGVAVLYISHRLDEVQALADRITVLRDGQMIGTWPAAGLGQRDMAELMVGRKLEMLYPHKRAPVSGAPILSVTELSVDHGRQSASFAVCPGEVLGIGGMIGAGRTELIEGLMGLRPSEAASVVLNGREIVHRSVRSLMDAGLVYLTEDRKGKGLLLEEKLGPNLTLQALDKVNPGAALDKRAEFSCLEKAVEAYDIRVRSPRLEAGKLSGGNQQKLLLAKVMMADPSVVVIDEPTRGIDIGNKSQIYDFIDAMVRAGKACIVISSEMPELVGLADRVLVMRAGRIVAEFRGTEINEENVVYAATTGGRAEAGEYEHDRSDSNNRTG
ncbi:sugar ABC transporter ATP-binding protein [Sinorhizobium medicae]|uniref:sugar ABC transporter ATP-binding protein n=1 Tax=Sinorhizobium medicae TaxID=110321 RepID=UPI0027DD9510|nr:sugar ABC transporter ATP-binding protein [Sinorhizobium medicae]